MFARMMPLVPALLVFLAAAGQDTYAIVDVDAPDMMVGLAVTTTKTLLDAAAAMKLSVVTPDQLRAKMEVAKYAALVKCGGGVACVSQYASDLGTKKVVLGSLARNEKNYLLKLWLIDVEKGEVIADVDRQVLIAARRLQKDVEQAAPPLLRGEREARGTLKVTSNVANAQLTLNGESVSSPPYEVQLRPGKYEVKIEKTKYLSVTRFVSVEANQVTNEELKMLLVPGAIPDEALVAGGPTTVKNNGEGQPVRISIPTWVAGAATLVALGIATGFGAAASGGDKALVDGFNPTLNTYKGTRNDALSVQQNALAANVSFGVAGAAGIATVIFLILDLTHSSAPVQVAPTAGPTGAGVSLGGHF